jgi:hypothetical protein
MRYNSRMEPAASIVRALGGPSKVAEIVGVHRTRVSNWMRPRAKGGTGGFIPQKHVGKLLGYAIKHDKPVSAASFIPAPAEAA